MADYSHAKQLYDAEAAQEEKSRRMRESEMFMDPGHDPLAVPTPDEARSFSRQLNHIVHEDMMSELKRDLKAANIDFGVASTLFKTMGYSAARAAIKAGMGTPYATALTGAAATLSNISSELRQA